MTSLNRRQLLTAGALGAAAVPFAASAAQAAAGLRPRLPGP